MTDARETQLQVPAQGRAAIFYEKNGPVKIENLKVPQPSELEPGQILVRVIYSGVCHTDLHALKGDWPVPNKLPLVGGHEGAGVVIAMGPTSDEHVKIGDRVGIKWIADADLKCDFCRRGHEPNCVAAKCSGYTVDGTFAQYVVSWARYVTPIPDKLSLADAAPILCAGVTVYRALKEAKIIAGQSVVIVGSGGGLGHLAVQYAAALGYRAIGIDTGSEKKAMTIKCGGEEFIDFKQTKDIVAEVKRLTGGHGAHAAVVAAAGAAAYEQALEYIRPRGTLVAVGLPPDTNISANVFFTVFRSVNIVGSYVGNRTDAIEALELAARGKVKTSYKTLGLSDLPQVYDDMEHGKVAGRIVLDLDK